MREIKITPAISALLTAIRSKEAPKGYSQVYSGIPAKYRKDVTKMTVAEVLDWQKKLRDNKLSKSTAAGGYQIIYLTLRACVKGMGLKGTELFNAELQDKMAVYLLQQRGLGEYMDGLLSPEDFANKVAMEWASVPVVTPLQGAKRKVKPGESYYDGDGLNAAHHDPKAILALVKAIKAPVPVAQKPTQPISVPEPPKVAQEEVKPPVASPEGNATASPAAQAKNGWFDRIRGWWA